MLVSRRVRVSALAASTIIGVGPSVATLCGQVTPIATSGAVQIRMGAGLTANGVRNQLDSLNRALDSLPAGDPLRPKISAQISQLSLMVVKLMAPSMMSAGMPVLGLVVDNGVQDMVHRAPDGARLLRDALPKGVLGFTVSSGLATQDIRTDGLFVTYFEHPLIKLVDPNSPADSAGIVPGARLIAYDGVDVCGVRINLNRMLQPARPVRVAVRVDGHLKEYMLTVAEAGDMTQQRRMDAIMDAVEEADSARRSQLAPSAPPRASGTVMGSSGGSASASVMVFQRISADSGSCDQPTTSFVRVSTSPVAPIAGMEVTTLEPQLKAAYGLSNGVFVKQTASGTPAEKAGIMAGDVILRVGSVQIVSIADLRRLLDLKPGEKVQVEFMRKGKTQTVNLVRPK